jgi:NADPH-dependent curcumin reductase
MSTVNHQFRLAAGPVGLPKRSDWSLTKEPVSQPSDGEFLVKILYISLDPAMRGWMNEGRSYIAPVGIGEVMRAGAVGRVIASKHTGFAVGDQVYGRSGFSNMLPRKATASPRLIQSRRRCLSSSERSGCRA